MSALFCILIFLKSRAMIRNIRSVRTAFSSVVSSQIIMFSIITLVFKYLFHSIVHVLMLLLCHSRCVKSVILFITVSFYISQVFN
uniref:Uncharacterized protein n=1 Tax=Anopheles darlingi TaxID=43151 RepID=A0A2M4D2A8_ANODA